MENTNQDRAVLLIQQGKYDLAEKELRRALAEDMDNGLAHAYLALCLLNLKKLPEALTEAQEAIAQEPDMPFAFYILSLIYLNEDKLSEAEEAIREGLRHDPYDADFYYILGSIHFSRKKWQEAVDTAEEGLNADPENVDCLNLRARALNRLGRKDLVTDSFETAFYQDPDNHATHANQGWVYLEQGNHKKSLEHFQEALRLKPNSEFAREGLVEALKAKYWIYRAVLNLSFRMQNMSSGARWGLTIGIVVLVRIMPLLLPFYLMLIFFTWFSDLIFNTLLRFNSYGRQALNGKQIFESNIFLVLFLGGIASLVTGLAANIPFVADVGKVLLGMLFPVAGTFNLEKKKAREKSLWFTYALAAVGVVYLVCTLVAPGETAETVFTAFFFGVIGYTWFRASLTGA